MSEERFAALQAALRPFEPVDDPRHAAPRTVVVVPSINLAEAVLEAHAGELPALEERWLYLLFALRRPFARIVFVSSLPVPDDVLEHYLSLMPEVTDARERLELLSPGDPTARPLAAKLLERPRLVRAIANLAGGPNGGFIMPFNVGDAERDLALAVGLPIYGIDHRFRHYGTKSGGRQLFAQEDVPHPAGFEDLASLPALRSAIVRLRAADGDLRAVVAKHDDAVYGDGNAVLPLRGLPEPGSPGEAAAIDVRLRSLPNDWLEELRRRRGVVEEMVEGEEVHSPSVQMRILPGGRPVLVSTHDQVLGGALSQSFVGCRFPADGRYAGAIVAEARKVGARLAEEGVVGRFGVDFVVARRRDGRWRVAAVEINLREGGTSHPYGTLWLLTDGRLDDDGARFVTPDGQHRCYFATDRLHDAAHRGITPAELIAAATRERILYEPDRQLGVVLSMLRRLEADGHIGVVAIGESPEDADERYLSLVALLDGLSAARTRSPSMASRSTGSLE